MTSVQPVAAEDHPDDRPPLTFPFPARFVRAVPEVPAFAIRSLFSFVRHFRHARLTLPQYSFAKGFQGLWISPYPELRTTEDSIVVSLDQAPRTLQHQRLFSEIPHHYEFRWLEANCPLPPEYDSIDHLGGFVPLPVISFLRITAHTLLSTLAADQDCLRFDEPQGLIRLSLNSILHL
ncbi:hypothetical protein D3C78_719470 [compost metagenome]